MIASALHRLCWCGWVVGSALVIASWFQLVSYEVGWIGFGIGAAGSLLSRCVGSETGSHYTHTDDPHGS